MIWHLRTTRKGAAAVEAALLLPLLIIVTLGVIDIGQFIVVKQNLCNASRLAARHAAKDATTNTAEVEVLVRDYLAGNFPQLSDTELSNAFNITFTTVDGATILANQLESLESGDVFVAAVSIDFAQVQWLKSVNYWNLDLQPVSSFARRE